MSLVSKSQYTHADDFTTPPDRLPILLNNPNSGSAGLIVGVYVNPPIETDRCIYGGTVARSYHKTGPTTMGQMLLANDANTRNSTSNRARNFRQYLHPVDSHRRTRRTNDAANLSKNREYAIKTKADQTKTIGTQRDRACGTLESARKRSNTEPYVIMAVGANLRACEIRPGDQCRCLRHCFLGHSFRSYVRASISQAIVFRRVGGGRR